MTIMKGMEEKSSNIVGSLKLFKILQSKLLLILSLINFAIQLPLLIQTSFVNHDLDNSISAAVIVSQCSTPRAFATNFVDGISTMLNQDNNEIVTLVYAEFASLLMILVASFNGSFSPYFAICGFILIQIIWAIIEVAETISLRKAFSDIGCGGFQNGSFSKKLAMESTRLALLLAFLMAIILFCWKLRNLYARARALTRNPTLMLVSGTENFLYISAYLWIGFSLLFSTTMVSLMSISMIFMVVALSVSWFRLGWLSIRHRNKVDLCLFTIVEISVILLWSNFSPSRLFSASWKFLTATWVLSIVLASLTYVLCILTWWCTRMHAGHIELTDQESSIFTVTPPPQTHDIESSGQTQLPSSFDSSQLITPSPALMTPSRLDIGPSSRPATPRQPPVPELPISDVARSTAQMVPIPSTLPPTRSNPLEPVRNNTISRTNGLAQTSVMRRGSGRREDVPRDGSNGSGDENPAGGGTRRPQVPNLTTIATPPTTTNVNASTFIPPPLIISTTTTVLPQPSSPTNSTTSASDSQSMLAQSQSVAVFVPLPLPSFTATSNSNPPSSFQFDTSSSSSSSTRRPPPDVPLSPTRRDTLASDYTVETLPSYRSRSSTLVATELPPDAFIPPVPPPPLPQYPALPSGPAQFLARRQTASSVRTYATLPSYRSPTASGSETGSETGDSVESEQMPIGGGRRASQRSIMSVPRSARR